MITKLTLPQAEPAMKQATIAYWYKAEGDTVTPDELLLELDADGVTVEVASGVEGTLRAQMAALGQTLPVGAPLAILAGPRQKIDEAVAEAEVELKDLLDRAAAEAAPKATPKPAQAKSQPKAAAAPKKETPVAPPEGAVVPVLMPQASNTMEEGTVVKWRVAVGDRIETGDIIMDIETDKAVVEVEAPDAGRLAKIVVEEGGFCPVKEPVAYLAESDADVEALIASQGGAVGVAAPAPAAEAPAASSVAAPPEGAVVPILMPQASNTMEEGTLVKWRVAVGDRIETGDIIMDIETDKAVVEVEAPDAGRLAKIVVEEGGFCPVKEPVAYLAQSDADVEAFIASEGGAAAPAQAAAPTPKKSAPKAAPAKRPAQKPAAAPKRPAATTAGGRVKASPVARRLAAERGVDLASVGAGRGPGGRIMLADVAAAPVGGAAAVGEPAIEPPSVVQSPAVVAGEDVREPMSKMRRAIARNLTVSKTTIPHWYIERTVDAGPMLAFYRGEKAQYKCSVNDVIVMACSRAIMEFPAFHSRIDGDDVVEMPSANIGVAVGTDDGLVVPVVQGAESLTLEELGAETRRLVGNAREGRIEGMGRGVFTISNLGMFGVDRFSAIINPPEAAILAVGAARETVVVKDGAMRPGRTMSLTLSGDHRIVDGLVGAQFMARLVELLEHPRVMM